MRSAVKLSTLITVVLADIKKYRIQGILDTAIIIGVLTLVYVLWGLKLGIVSGFATEQLNTPESLRIFVKPNTPLTTDHIHYFESLPEVGFVVPSIGFFNDRMPVNLARNPSTHSIAQIFPSGNNDPHLLEKQLTIDNTSAVIGVDLAKALGAKLGDIIALHYQIESKPTYSFEFEITGIVDTAGWVERAILIDYSLAVALSLTAYDEHGRIVFDGSKPNYGVDARDNFAAIRLYAANLEVVAPLVEKINTLGWRAQSREALIGERFALENSAQAIFLVILFCAGRAVTIALVLSNMNRFARLKSGLLQLEWHGMTRLDTIKIFTLQSLLVTALGWFCSLLLTLLVSKVMNVTLEPWFSELGLSGEACIVPFGFLIITGILLLLVDIMVSISSASFLFISD